MGFTIQWREKDVELTLHLNELNILLLEMNFTPSEIQVDFNYPLLDLSQFTPNELKLLIIYNKFGD